MTAFLRTEFLDDDRVYIGNFNVSPALRSAGIGEHFLAEAIQEHRGVRTIEAVAVPENVALTHYIEKLGFVGKHYDPEAAGTQFGWFDIEIPKNQEPYTLQRMSTDEITALALKEPPLITATQNEELPVIFTARIPKDIGAVTVLSTELLNHRGYTLTRHFSVSKDGSKRLYGFEKISKRIPDKLKE